MLLLLLLLGLLPLLWLGLLLGRLLALLLLLLLLLRLLPLLRLGLLLGRLLALFLLLLRLRLLALLLGRLGTLFRLPLLAFFSILLRKHIYRATDEQTDGSGSCHSEVFHSYPSISLSRD